MPERGSYFFYSHAREYLRKLLGTSCAGPSTRSEEYYWTWLRRATYECFDSIIVNSSHKILLDIGYGSGLYLLRYSNNLGMLIGLDIDKRRAREAKTRVRDIENIYFVIGSAEEIPFKRKSVNYIVCTEVLEHLNSPSRCIKEISRILRRRGFVLISTPNLLTIPPHPITNEHLGYLSPYGLRTIFKYYGLDLFRHVGTSFKFPLVRLGNKITFFYSVFDQITKILRNPAKELTQTIVMCFVKRLGRGTEY